MVDGGNKMDKFDIAGKIFTVIFVIGAIVAIVVGITLGGNKSSGSSSNSSSSSSVSCYACGGKATKKWRDGRWYCDHCYAYCETIWEGSH